MTGCPFYARAMHQFPGWDWQIIDNPRSNQCALIIDAHSPCIMQIAGVPPDWDKCPRKPTVSSMEVPG